MDRLPSILYHATLPGNVRDILRDGLVPQDESYVVGPDGVHLDRVFLSRFDDPWYMNLPAGKMEDAVVLAVDTSHLDRSRLYPDDTIYGAYFNDKLEDYELGAMFPDHYRRWGSSGSITGFGDWMDDNGPSDSEIEGILAGRFGLTLWNSGGMHGYASAEMGEVGYDGRIPPEAISLHTAASALRHAALRVAGQYLYHCTLADNLLDIAKEGLDPACGGANFSGGPDDPSGWVEGKLFLSTDPQKALYYGENAMAKLWGSRKTPPVLLRVPSSIETESDQYGDVYTENVIQPSLIEVKAPAFGWGGDDGKESTGWEWGPLTEELAEEARDAFSGDYLGRDEPLFLAPDFSPKASGYGVEVGPNEHGGVSTSVIGPDGEYVDDAYGDLHMGTAAEFHDSGEYFDPGDEPIGDEDVVAVLTGMELPEEMRDLGLGRRMVDELVGWAFSNGAEAVYTHAMGAPSDPDPMGFYEKLGFEEVGSSLMGTYMRIGNPGLREAASEPEFLKKLRAAEALPSAADASDALSSVMGGTLIHNAAGSTGTPGEDLSGKIQSILDNGLDPAYWAKPWTGSPGAGHPQAVYLSLAWETILDNPPPNYLLVEPRLSKPLVMRAGDADGNYTWGPALNEATGKSGAGLSSFLRSKGYDSVITVHKYGVGEVAYFGKKPLPASLPPEPDRTAHILGAAAEIARRTAAVGDIYRGVKTVVEKHGGKGLFARFSDVPKIGIRPSTEHHDPYGVYFYPVDWLAENAGFGTTYVNLPYITVAKIKRSGWLNLATVRPAKARELAEKGGVLEEYEARTEGKGLNQAKGGRAGKRLWDAVEAKVKPFESDANKMEWNRIFGRMGVRAIYDPGTGSVNAAEPSQIVVLDLSLIKVVDVVENREDRKSVFHAVLKAVADEVLDDGWRVSGSYAEGGISADGTVSGQPVAMSVLPAKGGFEMEVTLSYHDPSGRKRRIVSRGRMPNEWEDAPADYLAEGHAKSISRSLGEADIGPAGEEDAEDILDGALRALTDLRLPDLSVEEGEGGGAKFWKNTGDGKIEGSLKILPGGRRELELYAEDWLSTEDSSVIEIGPMRVSWEGDPSSASADMASELSRAVRELRVTGDDGKAKEGINRDAAAEIVRMRFLSWMFPDDILTAAGQKYERKKTVSAGCPHGDYQSFSPSPGGVRMPDRIAPDIHDAVQSLFAGVCSCAKCRDGDRVASSIEERCWASAAEALAAGGFPDMNGMCLEASVVLCERLREEGVAASLVRRWSDEHGGHWTVRTPAGEFDPTIAWWGDSVPEGAERGRLYEVTDGSPHAGWAEDASVDEAGAHQIAREELGVDDLEDLYDAALERRVRSARTAMPYLHEPKCPYCGHMGPQDPKVESWASLPDDYQELLHRHYGTDDRLEIARRLMWDRTVPTYCGECGRTYLFEKPMSSIPAERVAGKKFKAWHGTSSELLDEIREVGGLTNPYLAATPALAGYYAEAAAEDDDGEPIVLEIDIRDRSRLRYDGNAMDEPVTVGVSEDDRNLEWGRAEQEHPEWVRGDMISIPPEGWEYSWRGAHSVRYEGLLPLADIGGDINITASMIGTPFGEMSAAVRADITENLHDTLFAGTDVSHEVLRDVLADMDTPLAAKRLPVAVLAEQARATHSASAAAVAALASDLRRAGELDPVLTDGGRFLDGGHRVLAYEAEGRDTIPTVDISPLLTADWEAEFNEEIPGLTKAVVTRYWHGTTAGAMRSIEGAGRLRAPVHLADSPAAARGFAEMAADDARDRPLVLEVVLPPAAIGRLRDDPGFGGAPGNFVLDEDVPLEWMLWYPDPEDPDLTGPRIATALRAASAALATRAAEATPGNIEAARLFVRKWRERAAELGRPEPADAADACKFASMFAQRIFGADIRGNWDHQYAEIDGDVIELAVPPGADSQWHDDEFFGNPDHEGDMASCTPRVDRWEAEFRAENPGMFGDRAASAMRVYRAVDSGRGVMTDAIPGGTYFFPKRETAELWAGDRGTVVERIVDTAGASVQDVPEGELARGAADVLIRRDPDGSGEVLEVVVFDGSLIRTAAAWYYHGSAPDDILDIAQWGLLARDDRDGVSVTNDQAKARSWAGLKSGGRDIEVFRIPASALPDLTPEHAAPAEPDADFTAARQIPPEHLQIMRDGSWTPLLDIYGEFLDPVTASLSRAARAVGEHLGDTVTAYRALAAEHAEKVMREGFTGPHHTHGVYYTASQYRAAFYARFMASSRLQGVVFELEADTSRSQADLNDTTEWQSGELMEEVRAAASDMMQALEGNADIRLDGHDIEAWLGGRTMSEGYYEGPEQHSVWQLIADETKGTDIEMTIAEAREALPPGRYGEATVLDSRGVAGIDIGESEGQAMSHKGVPPERLKAIWIPSDLLRQAGETPPPGAETMHDLVDVIPAKFDADYDIDFISEIEKQRDEAREGYESDPPEGMDKAGEDAHYDGLEEVADAMDSILGRWRDESDSTMPGHIYSKLIRGERVTPEDLARDDGTLVRYPLPEGRLRATKVLRKAIARSEPGQGRRPEVDETKATGKAARRAAGIDVTDNTIARALRRAAEDIGWSEESDVDPDSFEDEGFVEDESGHAFWGSQGSGCLFVRNHPEDGWQLLLVKRSPQVEEPNTWGTTGGAVPKGESNLFASAVRETREEIGSIPPYEAVKQYVWKAPGGSFTYTTFILECTDMGWLPATFNWEATDASWVSMEDASSYDLHFGLSAILGDLGDSIFPKEVANE